MSFLDRKVLGGFLEGQLIVIGLKAFLDDDDGDVVETNGKNLLRKLCTSTNSGMLYYRSKLH